MVVCPAGAVTGGPHALHQLVHTANEIQPRSAAIMYQPEASTPLAYRKYDCPTVTSVSPEALVVLPEIWPDMAQRFPENRSALWWLSVTNFGSHGQTNLSGIGLHLCQSEYAKRHVRWKIGGESMSLTDWVDVPFRNVERRPQVVVNPAKDAGLMRPFREAHRDVKFVELRGLDDAGVAELLWSSQVYVDFGSNPGRDRPAREAALAGCVVLSVALGSARLFEDMPLDDVYKFDSLGRASESLRMVLADWSQHFEAQAAYRLWVSNQRDVFRCEVQNLLKL